MSKDAISVVIMIGGAGDSPQEQLVMDAQRASTCDLIAVLQEHGVDQIVVAAPSTEWLPADSTVIRDHDAPSERFHFGQRLASLIERYSMDSVMYFGGGSAPLIGKAVSGMIIGTAFTLFIVPSIYMLVAKKHVLTKDEDEVGVALGKGGVTGDETRVPAHQLHHAYPVGRSARLHRRRP